VTCKTCSGQGRWDDIPCTACGGTGGDEPVVTPLRTRAIDAVTRETCPGFPAVCWACRDTAERAVDALLAAGMLADPEECARTYSLISELIATGKDDDAERAYRLAVKAWRRARDVADGKPLAAADQEGAT